MIEANIKATDFLDIWLDLRDGSYKPYRKVNNLPVYINVNSNHPHNIKKQLPNMIQTRLSSLSCSKEMFESELPIYQDALLQAGYNQNLEYVDQQKSNKKRSRNRNIIWFNPPYSQSVKTNIGAKCWL